MRVAVCVWGLARSTRHTSESFESNILSPLRKAGAHVDLFVHALVKRTRYTNSSSHEVGLDLSDRQRDLQAYDATAMLVEDQDMVDSFLDFERYFLRPPEARLNWTREMEVNHVRALYSLNQVTLLMEKLHAKYPYNAVVFARPDVLFLRPILPEWIHAVANSPKLMLTPSFNQTPINDKFAICKPDHALRIGKRLAELLDYLRTGKPFQSEFFLLHIILAMQAHVNLIPFPFRRIRADGKTHASDEKIA
jgi:hypothetical protein